MDEKILIIDDEGGIRLSIKRLLRGKGYQVETAANGKEGLSLVEDSDFDLIILDMRMPEMSGIDVLREIRRMERGFSSQRARIPVVILTGFADEGTAIKAMQLRADDYVFKPFEVGQFMHSVEKCLRIKRLEKERLAYNQKLEKMVEERTKNLNSAQSQLIQSAKMTAIGQLGAGVAHELNNPLGGILGYAQLILEKYKTANGDYEKIKACEQYAEFIEREAIRCKKIVETLLNFSRKPSSVVLDRQAIGDALDETLAVCGNQLKLKQINVIKEISPDLCEVKGIKNQLEQVFTNLILNAQQAMPSGGNLEIKASNIVEHGDTIKYIKIQFSDEGQGISSSNLKKIFDPFFTTKANSNGTGLGLSVSYQIIRAHEGTIEVESEEGEGTTFTIVLPAVIEDNNDS